MSSEAHAQAWETLAQADPFWAILVRDDTRGGQWDVEEFFDSGRSEISWALDTVRQAGMLPAQKAKALDFGSGAGRLAKALGESFDTVVGVDISPTMRELATELNPSPAMSFVAGLDDVADGSIDFIYSSLVLQHLPKAGLEPVLAGFARVLADGGVALVHYPTGPKPTLRGLGFRVLPAGVVAAAQVRLLHYPAPMTMTWKRPAAMIKMLRQCGLDATARFGGPQHSKDWNDAWYLARPTTGPAA
jgi:SAM-dependent methyltransferase